MGKNLTEIAVLLIGVATVGLLIGNYQGTTQVIKQGGDTFNTLLRTVMLQNSGFGSFNM